MSSFDAVLHDAERIIEPFVPPVAKLAPVVGVLIRHLEKIAGHELGVLSDELLNAIAPSTEAAPPVGATPVQAAAPQTATAPATAPVAAAEPAPAPAATTETSASSSSGAGTASEIADLEARLALLKAQQGQGAA